MGSAVILHSDLNSYYASVEMMLNPSLRGKAVAVCGSTEDRHGIVLAKSELAKKAGVKTGQANWQARDACPGLICVPPQYDQYLKYSRVVRAIYTRYSDKVEPFGMDECWVDVSTIAPDFSTGREIAEEIRQTVKEETGLTVSIGVSFNKVFAKLGSDMKKPDAVSVLDGDNWRERIWPLPASELLNVGVKTLEKLEKINVHTIGELAHIDPEYMRSRLGKPGTEIWSFANGLDVSRVSPSDFEPVIRSVGHGTTCVADLDTAYAVWLVLYELAQDVGHRLRANELVARGAKVTVKDSDRHSQTYQMLLPSPTQSPLEIAQAGFALFSENYLWLKPVRALTICGFELVAEKQPVQLDMFSDAARRERRKTLDGTVDDIRRRFGNRSICAASLVGDLKIAQDKCETVTMPRAMYR